MPAVFASILKHGFRALGYAILGALLVLLALLLRYLFAGPPLPAWNDQALAEEFTAARAGEVRTLDDYRALEARLFAERDAMVRAALEPADRRPFNRFNPGSLSDPARWDRDWNRTFELKPAAPIGGALLMHGLTDSPYAMRAMAELLYSRGYDVVALRLPGHGVAPVGLRDYRVEDFKAAVRLAARDLAGRLAPGQPLYLGGYSTGAALSIEYSLQVLEGADLPRPAGLILMSPAVGVSPLAIVGRMRTGLSHLPGLGKLAWQELVPEYDPFKFNSFPWNAVGEMDRLTRDLQSRIATLSRQGRLKGFPRTLAFLSTVDSTIRADAVSDLLLDRLAPEGHELVLFDLNRRATGALALKEDPGPLTARLLARQDLPYTLTLVRNIDANTRAVEAVRHAPGAAAPEHVPLDLEWPPMFFSLSHVAIPFAPDDPLYGYAAVDADHIQLGRFEARGETGVLAIPPALLLRLRSNPFFPYMAARVADFVQTGPAADAPAPPPAP